VFVLGEDSGPDLVHVGYRLRDGRLLRLVWPALDQAAVAEVREMPLLANATALETRFRAANGAWLDRWPVGTDLKEVPGAVEIKLTLEGRGEFTRVFLVNR
jgi:general secretion pathway protein J